MVLDVAGSNPVTRPIKMKRPPQGGIFILIALVIGFEPAGSSAELLRTSKAQFEIYERKGARRNAVGITIRSPAPLI